MLFYFLAICAGWRTAKGKSYIADMVAPFIICYGMMQFIMHCLFMYGPETPNIDRYEDTIYYTIELMANTLIFGFCTLLVTVVKGRDPVKYKHLLRLYLIASGMLIALPVLGYILPLGADIIVWIGKGVLEYLCVKVLLDGFLEVTLDPAQRAKSKIRRQLEKEGVDEHSKI
jgi:hypothetical protein